MQENAAALLKLKNGAKAIRDIRGTVIYHLCSIKMKSNKPGSFSSYQDQKGVYEFEGVTVHFRTLHSVLFL